MGSYAYCSNCERGLDKPTIRQIISPSDYPYTCPTCGTVNVHHENLLDAFEELTTQIAELIERIERIERHLWPEDED